MQPSEELTADLSRLTAALDQPGADLQGILDAIMIDLDSAGTSFVGLVVMLRRTEAPTVLLVGHAHGLSAGAVPNAGDVVVPVTGTPFPSTISLRLTGSRSPSERKVCEIHLRLREPGEETERAGLDRLAEFAELNQALGALLGQGVLPDEALTEIHRRADRDHKTVVQAVGRVLDDMNGGSATAASVESRWGSRPRSTHPGDFVAAGDRPAVESGGGGDDFVRWLTDQCTHGLPPAEPQRVVGHEDLDPEALEPMIERLLADASSRLSPGGVVWIAASASAGGMLLSTEPGVLRRVRAGNPVEARFALNPLAADLAAALTFLARFAQIRGGWAWIDRVGAAHSTLKIWLPQLDQAALDELDFLLD